MMFRPRAAMLTLYGDYVLLAHLALAAVFSYGFARLSFCIPESHGGMPWHFKKKAISSIMETVRYLLWGFAYLLEFSSLVYQRIMGHISPSNHLNDLGERIVKCFLSAERYFVKKPNTNELEVDEGHIVNRDPFEYIKLFQNALTMLEEVISLFPDSVKYNVTAILNHPKLLAIRYSVNNRNATLSDILRSSLNESIVRALKQKTVQEISGASRENLMTLSQLRRRCHTLRFFSSTPESEYESRILADVKRPSSQDPKNLEEEGSLYPKAPEILEALQKELLLQNPQNDTENRSFKTLLGQLFLLEELLEQKFTLPASLDQEVLSKLGIERTLFDEIWFFWGRNPYASQVIELSDEQVRAAE